MSEESPEPAKTYESATARLEEIIRRLDSGEAQLRETLDLCEEAKGLIEFCAEELAAVDQGLSELKLEELAASLTGEQAATGDQATTGDQTSGRAEAAPQSPSDEPDVPF